MEHICLYITGQPYRSLRPYKIREREINPTTTFEVDSR